MHAALRSGAKQYAQEHRYNPSRTPLCFNKDTPPDLRAQYLVNSNQYGLESYGSKLSWMRQVSHGTLSKTTHQAVAAQVFFERERPEVKDVFRKMVDCLNKSDRQELTKALLSQAWSPVQMELMSQIFLDPSLNIWYRNPDFLDHYAGQAAVHGKAMNPVLLRDKAGELHNEYWMRPYKNVDLQQEILCTLFVQQTKLFGFRSGTDSTADMLASHYKQFDPLAVWHAHNPASDRCIGLASSLDRAYQEATKKAPRLVTDWEHREQWLQVWVSLLGSTPKESQEAVAMYNTMDPALLSFTTIAQAVYAPSVERIENMSELLCP